MCQLDVRILYVVQDLRNMISQQDVHCSILVAIMYCSTIVSKDVRI